MTPSMPSSNAMQAPMQPVNGGAPAPGGMALRRRPGYQPGMSPQMAAAGTQGPPQNPNDGNGNGSPYSSGAIQGPSPNVGYAPPTLTNIPTPGQASPSAPNTGAGGASGGTGVTPPSLAAPYQGQVPGPYGSSGGWNPFSGSNDPYQEIGQNQFQIGQSMMNQQGNLAQGYQQNEAGYGNLVNQLEAPIWAGGGGYTSDQQSNILQSQGLSDIQNQEGNNFLSQQQQQQITGNPYQALGVAQQGGQNLAQLAAQGGAAANRQVNLGDLGANGAMGNEANAFSSAINPAALTVSPQYLQSIQNSLGTGQAAVNAAQANPALSPTAQYLQQAQFSNADVAAMQEQGAQTVGAQFGATKDQLQQQAEASGNASPLAVASAMGGLDRASAASQSDAATSAYLQGIQAQEGQAQNIQNTQLNAGQYQSGLESSNALAEQNSGIAANTTAQQLQLAAAQGLTGTEIGAATTLGQQGIQNAQNFAQLGAGTQLAAAGLNTGAAQYNTGLQTSTAQNAEQQASNRAGQLATNQQTTNEYNQQQNLGINNALSQRYTTAYAPWVTAQQQGQAAAQNQEQYYGGQGNIATGQQLNAQNISQAGQLGAAAGGRANNQSSFGAQFSENFAAGLGKGLGAATAAAGSARGSYVDTDQLIQVGEHQRPEVILPLDPETPPQHQNQWEQMGTQLGRAMGVPQQGPLVHPHMNSNGYATGGTIGLEDPDLFGKDLMGQDVATDPQEYGRTRGYAGGGLISAGLGYIPGMNRLGYGRPAASTPFGQNSGLIGNIGNKLFRSPAATGPMGPQPPAGWTPQGGMPSQSPNQPTDPSIDPTATTNPGYMGDPGASSMMDNSSDYGGDIPGMAAGGLVLPRIPMPRIPHPALGGGGGLRLNMPIRSARISAPIKPMRLPMGAPPPHRFAHGGMIGRPMQGGMPNHPLAKNAPSTYRMNAGLASANTSPMPLSERGPMTRPAFQ